MKKLLLFLTVLGSALNGYSQTDSTILHYKYIEDKDLINICELTEIQKTHCEDTALNGRMHKSYPQLEKLDLSNSIERSVDDFFQRRMRNRKLEKVMGKRCEIIATDTNFVYYGYPYPPTMNEVTKADTIFKTQIKVLTKQFSSFETIEGYHVKSKIIQSLRPYFDSSVNYTVASTRYSAEFRLEPDKISVSMKFTIVKDFLIKDEKNFIVDLDKSSLEIISIVNKLN